MEKSGTVVLRFTGYQGVEYTGTCSMYVYHRFNFGNGDSKLTYKIEAYNAAGTKTSTKTASTTLGNEGYSNKKIFTGIPVVPNGYVHITVSSTSYDEFDIYTSAYANKA